MLPLLKSVWLLLSLENPSGKANTWHFRKIFSALTQSSNPLYIRISKKLIHVRWISKYYILFLLGF